MSLKFGKSPRWRFGVALALTVGVAAALAVPLALANTATPTSSTATWSYTNGSSGPVHVVVTGPWNWVTQSCKSGSGVSQTNVNGHYAIGFAGSWNDSTTPNTLTGKDTNKNPVTLHVGNEMDQVIADYCKGTTTANPYPTGTFRISHNYPSLAAFQADVPNGDVCVNGYDIHPADQTNKDWNPGQNGDNTLKAGQYVSSAMCTTAQPANAQPDLSIVKYERLDPNGNWVRGPLTGKVGQTVYYEMVVKNTGNISLDVVLSDPHCDAGTLSPTGTITLNPGDSQTYFCTHVLTKNDRPKYVNTATASGHNASVQSSTVSASSSVTTRLAEVKGVHHVARPPKPVVAPASFTG
jgi:hypothetical protein